MIQTIWATCKDAGGSRGIVPVVQVLRQLGYQVPLFVEGQTADFVLSHGEKDFTVQVSAEQIMVDHHLPDLLVTDMASTGLSLGQNLIPLLRGKSPVVALQDYWGGCLNTNWSDLQYRPDFICVNDKVGARIVRDAWTEFPESHIGVQGYPALDRYHNYDTKGIAAEIRLALAIPPDMPIVLYAGQWHQSGAMLYQLVAALNTLGRPVCLIPRMHPVMKEQSPEEIPKWEKATSNFSNGQIHTDTSSHDISLLIAAADIVVSMFSTVLVEAAVLRKPNISMLYPVIQTIFAGQYRSFNERGATSGIRLLG
ncbi:CDP-glycerol glycerophosphotransferase family protein [Patescibacteria group bacterium]|nr:CDP-glycerol glycerophosphotransferase family protein [Patescibacteria group bacterium]